MTAQAMRLPDSAVPIIVRELTRYGAENLETGGFLLAPSRDDRAITTVALAGEKGIERGWAFFRISGAAIDCIFAWAELNDLRIPAQLHSHMLGGQLSATDKKHGFNVPGFVSCVVPEFRSPWPESVGWAWWLFDGEQWVPSPAPLGGNEGVGVVWFDEDGVRDHA